MLSLSMLWIPFSESRAGFGAENGLEGDGDPISSPMFGLVESSSLDEGLETTGSGERTFLREDFCLDMPRRQHRYVQAKIFIAGLSRRIQADIVPAKHARN